ncbi:MAG TPA: hypothetical protein VHC39_13215 [Rhizomicrobium sp.]|nr:hypothetical protein [Rhizomicrobium sp.]
MDLWRQLTIDWPCRLGDWLWANIAVPLSTLPRQLTFRRIVYLAALLVAVAALAQVFTIDMAFFMAGDVAFYCEITSAVMLIVARGHISHAFHMAKAALRSAARRAATWYRHGPGARRQRGSARPVRRDADGDDVSDGDGAFGWFPALASMR